MKANNVLSGMSAFKKNILGLCLVVFIMSCQQESALEKEIAGIEMDVTVERYDRLFEEISVDELPELKKKYPFMFSKKYHDSVWISRKTDSFHKMLVAGVHKVFPQMDKETAAIASLFRHIKYYDPAFRKPRLITAISDVDYRQRIIVTDTITLIGIDTYLGSDHEFYENYYDYIKQNMKASQIVPDMATAYSERYIYQPRRKTLLDEMIYYGKQLYFKDMVIPNTEDYEKIGYTPEQYNWAMANETPIWEYFVERKVLFDTHPKLVARFINPAPFSKFELELDSESPGRLGQYIGWQIVRAYMENNEVSLMDMLRTDPEELFNKSKFKPKK